MSALPVLSPCRFNIISSRAFRTEQTENLNAVLLDDREALGRRTARLPGSGFLLLHRAFARAEAAANTGRLTSLR